MKMRLKDNARTTHESAENWYDGYGAHITTEECGDICHSAVDFDWLEHDDSEVAELLLASYPNLSADDRESLVSMARRIREAAESVVGLLEDAVAAYEEGDLDATVAALDAASSEESDHGDDPACRSLRDALLEEDTTTYVVSSEYRSSGNWLSTDYASETFDALDDAVTAADGASSGYYGPGEYRAVVTNTETGEEVHEYEWKVDPEQDKFDEATWLVNDEGEYSTTSYGINDEGEYLYTCQNGGSSGAHSRQEGDGRWSNMADEVKEITLSELIKALMAAEGGEIMDAVKRVAKAHPSKSEDDLVLDLADEWDWSDDEKESVSAWIEEEDPTYGDKINEALSL